MKTIRIGLLSFAHMHAEGYATALMGRDGVELMCTDPDSHRAGCPSPAWRGRKGARALGVPYVDTCEELEQWGPDAVIVCSENTEHRRMVEWAAERGYHVLCEKPIATSHDDAVAMWDACRQAGVFLMTAYPVRFSTACRELKTRVDHGQLGDLVGFAGSNNGKIPSGGRTWFTDPDQAGGGALVDHVVHIADILDMMLDGEQASSVWAADNRILGADNPDVHVETSGLVTVRYPSGLVGTIDCSWSMPEAAPTWGGLTLDIIGTRGTARFAPFDARVSGAVCGQAAWLGYGEDMDGVMLRTFTDAVRTGHTPQPDAASAIRSLDIMLAAQQSARSGAVVHLN